MCGIAGYRSSTSFGTHAEASLRAMCDAITHRGPDDSGLWLDAAHGVALGHRRLSILDLSPAGHQPMRSASGRYIIVYNGEIYNHAAIHAELAASGWSQPWRGHSDTEVLLAAFEQWGIEASLQKLVGMFAIALWDSAEASLTLIRDRMGEKPLYYGWSGQNFLFGSELGALERHPEWQGEIDRNALALMMRHNCIPAPYSIYRGIFKLRAGHMLTLRANSTEPTITCYWDAAAKARAGQHTPFAGSATDAVDQLEILLRQSIAGQMQADVPVGAFLSGGVDSSAVVALMQAQSSKPVHTFSIGFHESDYNEAHHAAAVAKHLGTEHTELYVTAKDAMDVIPNLPTIYSEPFADTSQIPTFLVAQLARRDVTVSLSGDAGDELFSGYNRYQLAAMWKRTTALPLALRTTMAAAIRALSPAQWDAFGRVLQAPLAAHKRQQRVGDKLHKFAGLFSANDTDALYRRLTSHIQEPEQLVLGATEPATLLTGLAEHPDFGNPIQQMMYLDMLTYLPDDILVKVDRAAMAVSLESRVPLLDHRIVEFALGLPVSILRHEGMSKWPLRQLLYRYVPQSLIERPKAGFGLPLDTWLRGALKPWAAELLTPERITAEGYFNPAYVQRLWDEHQSGRRNWQYQLWNILMFQAWLASRNHTNPSRQGLAA